jgi:hypothetical protein
VYFFRFDFFFYLELPVKLFFIEIGLLDHIPNTVFIIGGAVGVIDDIVLDNFINKFGLHGFLEE